jgi:hypothetical protein
MTSPLMTRAKRNGIGPNLKLTMQISPPDSQIVIEAQECIQGEEGGENFHEEKQEKGLKLCDYKKCKLPRTWE